MCVYFIPRFIFYVTAQGFLNYGHLLTWHMLKMHWISLFNLLSQIFTRYLNLPHAEDLFNYLNVRLKWRWAIPNVWKRSHVMHRPTTLAFLRFVLRTIKCISCRNYLREKFAVASEMYTCSCTCLHGFMKLVWICA